MTTRRRQRSWRQAMVAVLAALALVASACGDDDGDAEETQPGAPDGDDPTDDIGESLEADPALLDRALGTSSPDGVPEPVLAAFQRAGIEVTDDMLDKALECWQEHTCDTGTGGDVTVALADGFGENVWREVTHMEFVLQALTYPEIGEIIYVSAQGDTEKAISDFRSLIAQDVDVIATFPDSGEALLPTAREATAQGIEVVSYIAGLGGSPGEDYLSFVAEDLCQLGRNFAEVINDELDGEGKVAFLGGTPGNPLSEAWQSCQEPELADGIELVGRADTDWTREGTLQAVTGFLSQHPDLAGISYEYADGFLGGIRAYEAAGADLDLVLTLRTDEVGLFCEWRDIGEPDFRIFHSSGGGFDSRIALTAGMMALAGEDVPPEILVPAEMRQVDDDACIDDIPGEAPVSTLVPDAVLTAMYPG